MAERRCVVALLVVSAAAGVAVLLRFPPASASFYPLCPIHEYLHLQCPGCGGTRALAALLRGHFAEALRFNALFVGLLPLLAAYTALVFRRAWGDQAFRWPALPRPASHWALAAAAIFTLVRYLSQ